MRHGVQRVCALRRVFDRVCLVRGPDESGKLGHSFIARALFADPGSKYGGNYKSHCADRGSNIIPIAHISSLYFLLDNKQNYS